MVFDRVRATGLLSEGQSVVVLLSGGRDSVCLLDCAVELGAVVTALHVNYGLRPEADADEAHCRALCDQMRVPLIVIRAGKALGNVQAWARDVRLRAAMDLGPDDVATGHTATDQAETILYRLAASPGRRALLGMSPRDGRIVRPLLGVTREETARHNDERGLAWREDASNADRTYARARVRHDIVPALEAIHPAAARNIVRTADLLRDEQEVLDAVVDEALGGESEIALAALRRMPPALARLVVRRLAENATGELCPSAARRVAEIVEMDHGALDVGDGVRAFVEDGMLRMVPTPPLPTHA